MIRRLSSFLPRIVLLALAVNILCHAQSQLLTRHVREEVVNGKAQWIGQLPAPKPCAFDIVCRCRSAGCRISCRKLRIHQPLLPPVPYRRRSLPCGSVPASRMGRRGCFRQSEWL